MKKTFAILISAAFLCLICAVAVYSVTQSSNISLEAPTDENGIVLNIPITEPPKNPEDITVPYVSVPTTIAPPTQPAAQAQQAAQPAVVDDHQALPEAIQTTPENIARYAEDVEHNIQVFLEKQIFDRNNLDTMIENNDLDPDSPPIKEEIEELDILESEGEALLANYRAGLLSDEEAAEQLMNLYYKDWGILALKSAAFLTRCSHFISKKRGTQAFVCVPCFIPKCAESARRGG